MKKVTTYVIIVLVVFSLAGCSYNRSSDIKIDISNSVNFSKEDIYKAIDCLKKSFDFEAATLSNIYFDEEKSNSAVDDYLKFGKGSNNKVKPENVIVLLSDFDVDKSGKNPTLEPNTSYKNYNWILIRDDKSSDWRVDDWGY